MFKRKNDFEYDERIPRWLLIAIPVMIVVAGGFGVFIGQWLMNRDNEPFVPTSYPENFNLTATAIVAGATQTAAAFQPTATPSPISQPEGGACNGRVCLDVVILIDTTGSMGDEIAQLQNNFTVIAGEIDKLGNVDVRYGLVAYKDRGDVYVTLPFDFTADVRQFQSNLNALSAGGGGDNPEDMASAMETVLGLDWRDDNTVKLVFLVADAPPQLYGGFTYVDGLREFARQGIKVHSLASSGLDQPGEFTMRQIAQYTMGSFIFLTYDVPAGEVPPAAPAGDYRPDLTVGEPKDEQGVGEFTVEQLDDIVLRLIQEEVAVASGQ